MLMVQQTQFVYYEMQGHDVGSSLIISKISIYIETMVEILHITQAPLCVGHSTDVNV